MIAIGSGGFFGVGLGESVQKIFYLPEAHTDMILAVIGEELGLVGIIGVIGALRDDRLRRAARREAGARPLREAARRRASPSLILSQATLNFFAVLGMAPLTGVPLPFISYGSTNLIVLLAGDGAPAERGRDRRPGARRARKPRAARRSTGGRDADGS